MATVVGLSLVAVVLAACGSAEQDVCRYPQVGVIATVGSQGIEAVDFRGNCVGPADAVRTDELEAKYLEDVEFFISLAGGSGAGYSQDALCELLERPDFRPTDDELRDLQGKVGRILVDNGVGRTSLPDTGKC